MARYTVNIPKPEDQHRRNVKTKAVRKTFTDKETGKRLYRWVEERIVESVDAEGRPVYEMGGEPVWGLGCPAGCGRFWEFIADDTVIEDVVDSDGVTRKRRRGKTGSHFRPRDPAAYRGVDEKGVPTNGYLNFRPDPSTPSNVKSFVCDRCGAEIRLVRK